MSFSFLEILSIVLLVLGCFLLKRGNTPIALRLLFSSFFMFSIALYVLYAVSDYFTGEGINNAVIYHITQGIEGAGYSEYTGLIAVSIAVFALGLFLSYWMIAKAGQRPAGRMFYAYGAVAICSSLLLNPASADLYDLFLKPSLSIATESGKGEFYKYYRQPSLKQIGKKKNLVYIYAESMERSFFDEDIFPGLITGLRELESRSTTFTNVRQVRNTGWTIAGIVASQCGLPLFTPSGANTMSGVDKFLPSARCLSDLLSDEGYYLSYYGGAKIVFAGKKSFLKTHNFNEYLGGYKLFPLIYATDDYFSPWGLYDDNLLELVYNRFVDLSRADGNFALMTLTLDTHGYKGRPSKSCSRIKYGDGSNPFLNAAACSDKLITKFVKKILDSPFASNTVVVIASDHLAMRNTATDLLEQGDRTNMFMVIEPEGKSNKIDKHASILDIASTILPFIGFKGDVGLGRNIADKSQPEAEIRHIQENLLSWKPDIFRFWAFPKIKENLTFDLLKWTLLIDGISFYCPALVELTPELETTFKFSSSRDDDLVDYVRALDEDTHFLLFDKCTNTNKLVNNFSKKMFCLIAGKGGQYRDVSSIAQPEPGSTSIILSPEDIRFLTGIPSEGRFRPLRIAYAGGTVEGKNVTNSFDALNHNINKGFTYFELDFNFTSDGQLACIHDWDNDFKRSFGFLPIGLPTLKEFKHLVKNNAQFDMCTLDSLIPWLKENPKAKIITDVKDIRNIMALQIMAKMVPDFKNRIIPQIYYPQNYSIAKDMGYEQIIWTLYRYKGSNNDVLKWADKFNGPFAITMPEYRAKSSLPMLLAKKHVPTYVHTINERELANFYLSVLGVTELYTESLYPGMGVAYSMP